jgi:hypothetical protein
MRGLARLGCISCHHSEGWPEMVNFTDEWVSFRPPSVKPTGTSEVPAVLA